MLPWGAVSPWVCDVLLPLKLDRVGSNLDSVIVFFFHSLSLSLSLSLPNNTTNYSFKGAKTIKNHQKYGRYKTCRKSARIGPYDPGSKNSESPHPYLSEFDLNYFFINFSEPPKKQIINQSIGKIPGGPGGSAPRQKLYIYIYILVIGDPF